MMGGKLVLPSPLALERARSFRRYSQVAGLSAVLAAYAWALTAIKIAQWVLFALVGLQGIQVCRLQNTT